MMSKINLQEPQRNRNATANFVNLIRTSTVIHCVSFPDNRIHQSGSSCSETPAAILVGTRLTSTTASAMPLTRLWPTVAIVRTCTIPKWDRDRKYAQLPVTKDNRSCVSNMTVGGKKATRSTFFLT